MSWIILWAMSGVFMFVVAAGTGLAFGYRPANKWVFPKLLGFCLLFGPLTPVISIMVTGWKDGGDEI